MRSLFAVAVVWSTAAAAQINVDALSPSTHPSARRSCGAAVEVVGGSEHVWCFGGFGGNFLGDVWRFDTASEQWAPVTTSGTPSARDSHMFTFGTKPILFGGLKLQGIQLQHLNDLYTLNTATSTWTQLTQSTAKPAPRGFATFEYIPHQDDVLLFGGWDVKQTIFFGDLWRLAITGSTGTWTQPTATGTIPSARAAPCSAYDEARHVIVLFGGQTGYGPNPNNIPLMDDGTYELDVDTLVWTKVNTQAQPSPRAFCAAAYDPVDQRVVVYGGQGGADGDTLQSDAWSYDGATWTPEPLVDVAATPVDDPSFYYSPTLARFVMFGGRIQGGASSVYGDHTWTLDLERHPPVADAGADQSLNEGVVVTLNGAASSDADGTALSFAWVQTSGPAVTLSDPAAANPTFTAPQVTADTAVAFTLTADDGFYSDSDSVIITVRDALDDPPVADAGADVVAVESAIVTLDGTRSSDPDGDALAFLWTQIAGHAVVLDDPTSPAPRFTAPLAGASLRFTLEVDDGQLSDTDVVDVVVTTSSNAPPSANAGVDRDIAPGGVASLDGSASSDPNGTALQFSWTQIGGPRVTLDDDTAAAPSFDVPVFLVDVPLTFELTVSDGVFAVSDDVTLTVRATLGAPHVASVARRVAVIGTAYAYDDDDGCVDASGSGDSFTLLEGPAGMSVDAATGLVTWLPDVEGAEPVAILVENAQGSEEHDFVVDVYAPPVITSTPATTFNIGAPYAYDADDGAPSAVGSGEIRWSLLQGPSGMVVDVATGKITWIPVLDRPETVRLLAASAFGTDEQDFVIARPPDANPHIKQNANPYGAVGIPYQYDADDRVDIEGELPGDVLLILPQAPLPPGFLLAETQRYILWTPQVTGDASITLQLVTPLGIAVDTYTFTVHVDALGDDLTVAAATASPTSGPAPLSVAFDGSASRGSKGAPLWLYYWDTGDGSTTGNLVDVGGAADPTAQYVYNVPGSYTAALETWDPYGVFARDKLTISVLDGDRQPPTARIHADVLEGHDQLTVHLDCDCADPDGRLAGVQWSYGDGSFATDASPTHTYVHPGNYHVRVTAFDDDGLTGTDDVDIRVRDGDLAPPSAHIAATPAEGDQPMNVRLTADVADDDGQVVELKWSLPDGTQRTGAVVDTTFSTPCYFPVLLSATDNDGLVGRDVLTINVRADGVRPARIISAPDTAAVTGSAWHYDADDRASAQGGRPIAWRLGKELSGNSGTAQKIGAPKGMSIDFDTGKLAWTPALRDDGTVDGADKNGDVHVVIVAENGAGADLQEFDVHVELGAAPAGCGGCASSDAPGSLAVFALFGTVLAGRRRRHRAQRGARALAVLVAATLGAATAAQAQQQQQQQAPVITSAPVMSARVGEVYTTSAAVVDGEAPFAFALGEGPAGVVVDNVDGRILWMPATAGPVDLALVVVDRNGSGEQRFTVDVAAGAPPAMTFAEPEGGYAFRIDEIGTLVDGQFLIPIEGDQPMQFSTSSDNGCSIVTPNGIAILHQAFAGSCRASFDVVNPWGTDHRDVTFTFVDPPEDEKTLAALLSASPIEGPGPVLVTFDASASKMPSAADGYALAVFLWPGDGSGVEMSPDDMHVEHLYAEPGTYTATLEIIARDEAVERAAFASRASVSIVVDEADSRPPAPALLPDVSAGRAPLSVRFNNRTLPGDAPIAAYDIDFGDGDRFEAQFSDFADFEEPHPQHTYARPGAYTATLTVVDAQGRTGTAGADILATAAAGSPPVARILAFPSRGEVPLAVQLDSEKNDLDGYVVRSTWILPDGSVSGAATPTITLTEPGDHVVELVVADDDGLETRVRAVITATKDGVVPPRVVSTANLRAVAGQTWSYDADGVISVTGGGPYAFSLGKKLGDKTVNAPRGMQLEEAKGKLAWSVPADVVGEVPVSIVVQNAAGTALHEFVIVVGSGKPKPAPASCAATTPDEAGIGAALIAVAFVSRRRRASCARTL